MKSDRHLQDDVIRELRREPRVQAEQIGVSLRQGVVELNGKVASEAEQRAAEQAAMRVPDVVAVVCNLKVVTDPASGPSDEEIARAALGVLDWNYLVRPCTKVKVKDGWVTLLGAANWEFQSEAAETAIRRLNGVRGVTNRIVLRRTALACDVKRKIEQAIKRNAALDAARIEVESAGSTLTLRGQVRSAVEREEAVRAAWAAPGITAVEDLITIS